MAQGHPLPVFLHGFYSSEMEEEEVVVSIWEGGELINYIRDQCKHTHTHTEMERKRKRNYY